MPSINEVSALQRKLSATKLEEFSQRYPSLKKEMQGFWAGPPAGSETLERAHFTDDVMQEAIARCDPAISVARAKIARGRLLALAGQLFSILGGGAIIGCLGLGQDRAALITALITFLASVSTVVGAYVTAVPGDSSKRDIVVVYGELCNAKVDLRSRSFELGLIIKHGSEEELNKCVSECNALCRKVNDSVSALLIA